MRSKLFCEKCGDEIKYPHSHFQRFCDKCYKVIDDKKLKGGIILEMAEKINIPRSMLKKFLALNGYRVPPEAINLFEKELIIWASNRSKEISDKTLNAKRKTILPVDFEVSEKKDYPFLDNPEINEAK